MNPIAVLGGAVLVIFGLLMPNREEEKPTITPVSVKPLVKPAETVATIVPPVIIEPEPIPATPLTTTED